MADLLGATNPVPGYDGSNLGRGIPLSPNDPHIQNIPDPTRVGRPDARTDQQDSGDLKQTSLPRYDSNFQTFLQQLREMPDLLQEISRLLMRRGGTVVTSGVGEGLAGELAQVMEMLKMDEGAFKTFFANQMKSGVRFGGALFTLLRSAYHGTQSQGMREDILQFLKKFSDYSSTRHIEGNLLRDLGNMARSVPASWGGRLLEMAAKLQNGIDAGDRAGNLKLLQGELFPYMGDYVEHTHDMGKPRALLTLMALDVARYENGSEENLLQAFHQLTGYGILKETLGGIKDSQLLRLLQNTEFARAATEDGFAAKLAGAAASALRGEGGPEAQEAFREIVAAILINESVYMPVNHLIIPLEWNGRMMFSELWVDPDAENDWEKNRGEAGPYTLRFLMKMDIQGAGLFDVVMNCRQQKVELQIRCPEHLTPFSDLIREDMAAILRDSGLEPTRVEVEQLTRALSLSEVFPKLFEGKNSVDVKV